MSACLMILLVFIRSAFKFSVQIKGQNHLRLPGFQDREGYIVMLRTLSDE